MGNLSTQPPSPVEPFVDPATGTLTQSGFRFLYTTWQRSGSAQGTNSAVSADVALQAIMGDAPDAPRDDMAALWADPVDYIPPPDLGQAALLALMLGDVAT